ncbi:MAG: PTS fructose transporter subunit IIA [Pseudomonadota bacterium]
MSIGVLILAHEQIGAALLQTAARVLGSVPLPARSLTVAFDCNCEQVLSEAARLIDQLDSGAGVLVLTDMYGSTPANLARALKDDHRVCVLTGVNLPMLLRIFNYPQLSLAEIAAKAEQGGRDGVFICGDCE